MKTHWLNEKLNYDGSQLRPLYTYETHKVLGNSILSWIGACDVKLDHMVDYEDKIVNSLIKGDLMLHFIVEVFDRHLGQAVALQRLFAATVKDLLVLKNKKSNYSLTREGDDIYLFTPDKGKMSISIASCSSVSSQIHFAINVVNTGTPVKTGCLTDLLIDPVSFAKEVMASFSAEYLSIVEATQKVKPL